MPRFEERQQWDHKLWSENVPDLSNVSSIQTC